MPYSVPTRDSTGTITISTIHQRCNCKQYHQTVDDVLIYRTINSENDYITLQENRTLGQLVVNEIQPCQMCTFSNII